MNPVCPYCSVVVAPQDGEGTACPSCGAAHHAECWAENGGCTVFGCASSPADEPVLTVDPAEVSPVAPAPPPEQAASPPPPPPRPEGERPLTFAGYSVAPPTFAAPTIAPLRYPRNRVVFILLGVFLGAFGAHNFYAGYTNRAVAQLSITLCTLFLGSIISWIWALAWGATVLPLRAAVSR